jgi:hypothetical protein
MDLVKVKERGFRWGVSWVERNWLCFINVLVEVDVGAWVVMGEGVTAGGS